MRKLGDTFFSNKTTYILYSHNKESLGQKLDFLNSRIRETPTLLTNADSRTNTNLKRKRDFKKKKFILQRGDKASLDRCA